LRGAALSSEGVFDDAAACLREGLAVGTMFYRPYGFARLAEALTLRGSHEAALSAVKDGQKVQEETGNRTWEAELYRLEGVAFFGLNRLEEGQGALEKALGVARQQRAKAYELRAATSLARLWGERSRRAEARLRHRRPERSEAAARRAGLNCRLRPFKVRVMFHLSVV